VNISPSTSFTIVFNEAVKIQDGLFQIIDIEKNQPKLSIPSGSDLVTKTGDRIIQIELNESLDPLTEYRVQMDSLFISDMSDNLFSGFNESDNWTFITSDTSTPSLTSTLPISGQDDVPLITTLTLRFDHDMLPNSGFFTVIESKTDSIVYKVDVTSSNWQGQGTKEFKYTSEILFEELTEYYVLIDSAAFVSSEGVPFSGIQNKRDWVFKTQNDPNNDPPVIPDLLLPADNSMDVDTSTQFFWSSVSKAESYEFWLALMDTSLITEKTSSDTSFTIENLTHDTSYLWKVRAANTNGVSSWSELYQFRTRVRPLGSVTLVAPSDGAESVDFDPIFEWNSVEGATEYTFQVSEQNDFSTTHLDVTLQNQTEYQLETLLSPTTLYYWRVRPLNSDQIGEWSLVNHFITKEETLTSNEGSDTEIPSTLTLKPNFPNPFNPSTTIRFGLPEAMKVNLELYDLLGRRFATFMQSQVMNAGWHEIQIDASRLTTGNYIIFLSAKDQKRVQMITLIR
jgi:hypothetical protein